MKEIKELTGLYSLTKTIGVELKPVGKTQELIEARKLIEQDDQRAEDYKIVKDIIDRYHKDFIDKCLNCVKIKTVSQNASGSGEAAVTISPRRYWIIFCSVSRSFT